jgi:RNA polymerase II subunit A-like phosphatase
LTLKKDTDSLQFLRPGLTDFLRKVSERYEMHVYTMGTRAYASAVCNIIDPDGEFFAGRILSRDESGSGWHSHLAFLLLWYLTSKNNKGMTQKSLTRLFPCDTSMVVVIDDRADVWEWSPNLVKVVPCKFAYPKTDIHVYVLTLV